MAEPTPPNTIVPASREVIESKLLTALEDEGTVAVLYTEPDLRLMILALESFTSEAPTFDESKRAREMLIGIAQLYQEAFSS